MLLIKHTRTHHTHTLIKPLKASFFSVSLAVGGPRVKYGTVYAVISVALLVKDLGVSFNISSAAFKSPSLPVIAESIKTRKLQ